MQREVVTDCNYTHAHIGMSGDFSHYLGFKCIENDVTLATGRQPFGEQLDNSTDSISCMSYVIEFRIVEYFWQLFTTCHSGKGLSWLPGE